MKVEVNDNNFDKEVLEATLPVIVDFWAEWCMPCKMLEPVINEIAREYEGKVKVCSLNVDEARQTAGNYGIMSIPTLILFKSGKVVEKSIGSLPKDVIVEKLIKPNI